MIHAPGNLIGRDDIQPVLQASPPFSAGALGALNYLRFVAMACRTKRRSDLFKACALLHASKSATCDAYAEALMRCLPEALGKPARLRAPGVAEMTFDESWLAQLCAAFQREDEASVRFLLASRVGRDKRRLVAFLTRKVAATFAAT